ncbi:DUF302 domain-containing protein [Bacillus testis]|uniref:DUF302 domain-containing protein n=1 Tax=Bacillus testis TaxID=1622072 RepID=UPI00067E785E|nr:DUF302 domain-containing protein [Bacillus testis]
MFHYTIDVPFSVEEAITRLEASLKEEQFGVQFQFNVQETLQKKGFDFDSTFVILEVCNPKEAKRVLEEDLMMGYFLPCKLVVYEKENQTKVGMLKPTALTDMIDNEQIKAIAGSIEERLKKCMDQLK